MNAVHAIGIHVVGKTAAASNTTHNDYVFFRYAQIGHYALHLCQYAVIATAGAPPYFLIAGKIFSSQFRLLGQAGIYTHNLYLLSKSIQK